MVQDRFERVDDPLLLPHRRSDLLDVEGCHHLVGVLLQQLCDGSVPEVGLHYQGGGVIPLAELQNVHEGRV